MQRRSHRNRDTIFRNEVLWVGIGGGIEDLLIEPVDSTDLPEKIEFQIDIVFASDDFDFFSSGE